MNSNYKLNQPSNQEEFKLQRKLVVKLRAGSNSKMLIV